MKEITVFAPAKLNLTLDILGLREDGYHELDMLMQTVSLCDEITIQQDTGTPWSLHCTDPRIPCDARNLAWQAAAAFFRCTGILDGGLHIHITKRIPMQAGLAGGSADAAGVLRALNELNGAPLSSSALCSLAAQIGSDIPFCVLGGTARAKGRGELLTPMPIPTVQHYVICKPEFGISTPKLFALSDHSPISVRPAPEALLAALRQDAPQEAGRLLCNVLESVAAQVHPELIAIKQKLLDAGACGAQMTGSGSAIFGLFSGETQAKFACAQLKNENFSVFYAHSV